MKRKPKLWLVKLSLTTEAAVVAETKKEAERIAVEGEIQTLLLMTPTKYITGGAATSVSLLRRIPEGWDEFDVPYGGEGYVTIHEWLEKTSNPKQHQGR